VLGELGVAAFRHAEVKVDSCACGW